LGVGRGVETQHKKQSLLRNVNTGFCEGCFEDGKEPWGSIKGGEYLD